MPEPATFRTCLMLKERLQRIFGRLMLPKIQVSRSASVDLDNLLLQRLQDLELCLKHELPLKIAEHSAASNDIATAFWQATGRYSDARSISRFESKVYSQNGEDGIIAEIFNRIGSGGKYFVEIGVENGIQCNTRLLLEGGWSGMWVEGNKEFVEEAYEIFKDYVDDGKLVIVNEFVTMDNINGIVDVKGVPLVIDFISIDVDYNTSHIWRELKRSARVSCVEYNGSLPTSACIEVPYDPKMLWDGSNYYGASLKVLQRIAEKKFDSIVGCDPSGVNAFFVNSRDAEAFFLSPFTAEYHFEPPRYIRAWLKRGHAGSRIARRWVDTG